MWFSSLIFGLEEMLSILEIIWYACILGISGNFVKLHLVKNMR